MKFRRKLERLKKLHHLIVSEKTGTPTELAGKLSISQSQLFNILDDMKLQGFPIAYSRKLKNYYYTKDCFLEIDFEVRLIMENKITKLG